jgi:protein gp37
MGETTGIAWCDHTFNPWRGCTKVSAGCEHCYAETLSKRNPEVLGSWGPAGSRSIGSESYWRQPEKWNRAAERAGIRRRVFCLSLGDVFEDRPELVAPRSRLFDLISDTPHLDWLLLTKRPENIIRLADAAAPTGFGAPAANLWMGVSVEDQATADERIPLLLQTPAALRFVSYEPALGPVSFRPWLGTECTHEDAHVEPDTNAVVCRRCEDADLLDWLIVGGESGPGARPFDVAWARSAQDQCKAAGVAFFFKQAGSRVYMTECAEKKHLFLGDRKGGDPNEWPEDLRVREFPP